MVALAHSVAVSIQECVDMWLRVITIPYKLETKVNFSINIFFLFSPSLWTIVRIFEQFQTKNKISTFFVDWVKKSRRRSRRVKAVKRLNSNVIAAREFIDIFRDQESPRSAIINHHHSSVYTLMGLQEYHMACVLLVNIDYKPAYNSHNCCI